MNGSNPPKYFGKPNASGERPRRTTSTSIFTKRLVALVAVATSSSFLHEESLSTLAFSFEQTASAMTRNRIRKTLPSTSVSLRERFLQTIGWNDVFEITTCLEMAKDGGKPDEKNDGKIIGDNNNGNNSRKRKKRKPPQQFRSNKTNMTAAEENTDLVKRVRQLEQLVANQAVQISRLRDECRDLSEAAGSFAQVVELLREAGLTMGSTGKVPPEENSSSEDPKPAAENKNTKSASSLKNREVESEDMVELEYFNDSEIFGSAPSSVIDAADAAGAAILAAMLGGKQRMLVDVRDAELSRDPDIFVQFIELAILPVAAGLEGLYSERNRVKVVFPTVGQLLQYRKTMALAAPEVVSLSTLGFDPVEEQDSLVVIIAPAPNDDEGLAAMNELLKPTDPTQSKLKQPVVVLNHHMVPASGPAANYEVVYHLRLLSVQYMTGDMAPEYFQHLERSKRERNKEKKRRREGAEGKQAGNGKNTSAIGNPGGDIGLSSPDRAEAKNNSEQAEQKKQGKEEDEALEAAMEHARDLGIQQGITRAMVIRAYPRPWHVFVDTSPDTDADFEVAATFDEEPSQDDVNYAIIECLEGSEREDELVAQQMQLALEAGQLSKVSEMLGISPTVDVEGGEEEGLIPEETTGEDEVDEEEDSNPP